MEEPPRLFTTSCRLNNPIMMAGTLSNPTQYLQTVRHLKPRQVFYRFWYRYHTPDVSADCHYQCRAYTTAPVFRPKPALYEGNQEFTFLGRSVRFPEEIQWTHSDEGVLWSLNLHYFDYINNPDTDKAVSLDLIKHWVVDHLVAEKTGWASFPTSLRIVNWVKFELEYQLFSAQELDSLFVQCRWLSRRIEFDILANHLLANAKALVFGGLFFCGEEPCHWLRRGLKLLQTELGEQINHDGSHFEFSPMYQAIILEDLIDLLIIIDAFGYKQVDRELAQLLSSTYTKVKSSANCMLSSLESVTHPDGEIGFFNDSAMEIAPTYQQLAEYFRRTCSGSESHETILGQRQSYSSNSENSATDKKKPKPGFIKSTIGKFTLISNVAPVTPGYQPSHAHADTLSFELSFEQQRILVNSGTSTYNIGELRQFQRSTRAHNTLEIDNKNSSDVWASFRVGKRAHVIQLNEIERKDETIITATHNGYKNLFGGVTHKRIWQLQECSFTCTDTLDGQYSTAKLFFYFHPDIKLESDNILKTPNGELFEWTSSQANLNWQKSAWYPGFGQSRENLHLQIEIDGKQPVNEVTNRLRLITRIEQK